MEKWEVLSDPKSIRRLGKLVEELGELSVEISALTSIAGRCLVQGLDGIDPCTRVINTERLRNEIADVYAQLNCAVESLGLDAEFIKRRASRKVVQMREWDTLVDATTRLQAVAKVAFSGSRYYPDWGEKDIAQYAGATLFAYTQETNQ